MLSVVSLSLLTVLVLRGCRALVAVAVSLGACHAVSLSTSSHATVRLMVITVLEALRQDLRGASG